MCMVAWGLVQGRLQAHVAACMLGAGDEPDYEWPLISTLWLGFFRLSMTSGNQLMHTRKAVGSPRAPRLILSYITHAYTWLRLGQALHRQLCTTFGTRQGCADMLLAATAVVGCCRPQCCRRCAQLTLLALCWCTSSLRRAAATCLQRLHR